MESIYLFIFLNVAIFAIFSSTIFKVVKRYLLLKELQKLERKINIYAQKIEKLRDLFIDYFSALGKNSKNTIVEIDTILGGTQKEISNIHSLLNQCSYRSLYKAKIRIAKLKGVNKSLKKKIEFSANAAINKKKPTWEFKIDKLVELGATQIMKASRNAKKIGLESRNRTRKATTEILAGIAFVKL